MFSVLLYVRLTVLYNIHVAPGHNRLVSGDTLTSAVRALPMWNTLSCAAGLQDKAPPVSTEASTSRVLITNIGTRNREERGDRGCFYILRSAPRYLCALLNYGSPRLYCKIHRAWLSPGWDDISNVAGTSAKGDRVGTRAGLHGVSTLRTRFV